MKRKVKTVKTRYHFGREKTKGKRFKAPICSCCNTRPARKNGTYNVDGSPYFRKVPKDTVLFVDHLGKPICSFCLQKDDQAKKKDWAYGSRDGNPRTYVKHRKDYCENIDGRLGFKCTTSLHENPDIRQKMLDVDHINGDKTDNRVENLQTLCASCHRVKTHYETDLYNQESVTAYNEMLDIISETIKT